MKKILLLALLLSTSSAQTTPAFTATIPTANAAQKRYVISELGAVGDGVTVNTKAIQAAIDRCAAQGGGVLVVPAGTFLSGALYFKQGVNLLVEKNAILKSTTSTADFPAVYTRWEGIERYWTAAFLNFVGLKNVVVSGEGTIDGSGTAWGGGGAGRGGLGAPAAPSDDLKKVNAAIRQILADDPDAKATLDKYPSFQVIRADPDTSAAQAADAAGAIGVGIAAGAPGFVAPAAPSDDLKKVNTAIRQILADDSDAKAILNKYPDFQVIRSDPDTAAAGAAGAGRGNRIAAQPQGPAPDPADYYAKPFPTTATLNFAPDRANLPPVNAAGIRVSGGISPPRSLVFQNCENVRVSGIYLLNEARWGFVFIYCQNVIAENLTAYTETRIPSSDGMDVDSCQHVLITGCSFDDGDDDISIKSGKDEDGRRVNIPCDDLIIEKCRFGRGDGGAAMGSETSGGIRNVIVRDCTADGNAAPVRFKTQVTRGGVVENISYSNITVANVRSAFEFNLEWSAAPSAGPRFPPVVRNVTLTNISGTATSAGIMHGLTDSPIDNVTFINCNITSQTGLRMDNVTNAHTEGLKVDSADGNPISQRTTDGPPTAAELGAAAPADNAANNAPAQNNPANAAPAQ